MAIYRLAFVSYGGSACEVIAGSDSEQLGCIVRPRLLTLAGPRMGSRPSLDARYVDADGDMVADIPTDAAQLVGLAPSYSTSALLRKSRGPELRGL